MRGTRLLFVLALSGASALAGFAALEHREQAPGARELVVVATGEVTARVRRCGCQGEGNKRSAPPPVYGCACHGRGLLQGGGGAVQPDIGAFPERAAFVAALGGDPLVVDSGDLLFPGLAPADWEREEWRLRAELICDLEPRLRLAAFEPGELDLALGRRELEALAARGAFPFVSANLRDARTHAPVFSPRVTAVRGGLRVGITGIFAPPPSAELDALLAREGLEVSEPAAALREQAAALRAEGCEAIVLLAHAPDMACRAILRAAPDVDLVVESHGSVATESTSLVAGRTAFVAPYPGGGVPLRVRISFEKGAKVAADGPTLEEARGWATRIRAQLEGLIRDRERATKEKARELDEQIEFSKEKLASYEAQLPKEPVNAVTAQGIVLVAADWKHQDRELLDRIDRFKTDVDRLELAPAVVARLEAPGKLSSGAASAFATEATCAACHKEQVATWAASKHAHAWASLERSGSEKDPECVRCHSIGFREPGGFAEPKRSRRDRLDFEDVQCEACHGPRAAHPATANVGIHLPGIEQCQRCHDPEHDPGFSSKKFADALTRPDKVCVKGLPR